MKTIILNLLFISISYAGLKSPFPSSVEGISINNTHALDKEGRILRGQAPLGKIEELVEYGITDILIFKNQTRKEIDQEYAEINKKAKNVFNVRQLDFFWHDFSSYKQACEQTIEALQYIKEVYDSSNRKIFFHCTVGEDRTGMLAGLWKLLTTKYSISKVFHQQMCENGYGKGNRNKPFYVYNEIRKDLTPLFNYMAKQVTKGNLSLDNLDNSICKDKISKRHKLKCENSSKFPKN